jgi:hypothetical protein
MFFTNCLLLDQRSRMGSEISVALIGIIIKLFLANVHFYDVFHDDLPARDIIDKFYVILNDCLDRFVPSISRKINANFRLFNYPFNVRKKIREKSEMWRVHRAFRTPESLASYREAASQCKTAIYSFVVNHEKKIGQ